MLLSTLNVVPPKVRSISGGLFSVLEEEVNLTCEVSGYPSPNITWQKNGVELPEQDDGQITLLSISRGSITISTLQICSVQKRDSGNYTCAATNSFPGQQTGVQSITSPQISLLIASEQK